MADTAAMAAAPHDGFDHAAIPNDDALSWPRVPHGLEAAVSWRPPRAEGATAPRAAVRQRRHRPWLTKGVGHEEGVAMGQREGVAVGARGPRAAERAKGLGKFPWLKVPSQPGTWPGTWLGTWPGQGWLGRVAVTVWRWPCGGGHVAVTVWRWPCGGGRVAVTVWRSHDLSRDLAG